MEVRVTGNMFGLFSTKRYEAEQEILEIEGEEIPSPTPTSIQVGHNKHIEVDFPCKFINHSCSPNTKVEGKKIIAIKEINAGDEITFNYNSSEDKLNRSFICRDCGKRIAGKLFQSTTVCLR